MSTEGKEAEVGWWNSVHHIDQKIKHHGITALTLGRRGFLLSLIPRISLKMIQKEKHELKTLPSTKPNPLHIKHS